MAKGLVKYELQEQNQYADSKGKMWDFKTVTAVTARAKNSIAATILVQLTDTRKLKVEVFKGKTAAQVTNFDDKALTYTRGDGATTPVSNTAY